ncbi:MAG: hypothetical protein C0592_03865 [Marinilabiliales bacterium]|nr:MAG: hypothetical protein C0592_03865 [Marinilabiliales bacterium]
MEEANILYKYERAAWMGTDMTLEDRTLRYEFRRYIVYEENDSIFFIALNSDDLCISTYVFYDDFTFPTRFDEVRRKLNSTEKNILKVRNKILEEIVDNEYEIEFYDDFTPNFILLPYINGYKMYMIMGTSKRNVIPFGNDYIFFADEKGRIESYRQFHKTLISTETEDDDGNKIASMTHSHLEAEPFITATDICTFRLYADIYELEAFSVYSTALSLYFKYNYETNTISIEKKTE